MGEVTSAAAGECGGEFMGTWWSGGNSDDDWIIVDVLPSLSPPPPGSHRPQAGDSASAPTRQVPLQRFCRRASYNVRVCVRVRAVVRSRGSGFTLPQRFLVHLGGVSLFEIYV